MQTLPTLPIDAIYAALERGNAREAERLTRDFLESAPDDENGMLMLGVALDRQGRSADAAQVYGKLVRMFPQSAMHWNNLGTVLRSAGQVLEAEEAYRRAIELEPGYFDALMNLGYLYLQRGIYPPAQQCFLHAHALDPASPDARIYAAQVCFALDSRDRAEELIEPWRSWTGLSDELALELAILMTHFGKAEDGTRIFERLLRDNPNNLRAIAHLAVMFERVNRLDEARAMLARLPPGEVITDAALLSEVNNARATLAMREKDPARARALLEQMVAAQEDRAREQDRNQSVARGQSVFRPGQGLRKAGRRGRDDGRARESARVADRTRAPVAARTARARLAAAAHGDQVGQRRGPCELDRGARPRESSSRRSSSSAFRARARRCSSRCSMRTRDCRPWTNARSCRISSNT